MGIRKPMVRKPNPYIVIHKIRKGETLPLLANVYQTTPERIYKLNQNSQFQIGQVIKIPDNR